jgi:Holliday junction resolvase RusA-like endonuclease
MTLSFCVVHGHIHKQRPRVLKSGRSYTPKETAEAESAVRESWAAAARQAGHLRPRFSGPLAMRIFADIQIPKSRRDLHEAQPHTQKPDCDNIAKLVMDALNGVAYKDDSYVFSIQVIKRWTTDPTQLRIEISDYE